MPGKKSSDKGKTFERRIAKVLSDWCGIELIRTPMSGAWQGTSGDILPKSRSQFFPFLIECKNQEDWSLEQLLAGVGPFQSWLKQVYQEMERDVAMGHECKSFLLIFTRNHKPDYIAMSYSSPWAALDNYMVVDGCIYVSELQPFLSTIPYNTLLSSVWSTEPEILSIPILK